MKIVIKPNFYIIATSSGMHRSPNLKLEIIGNDEVVNSIILGEYYEENHEFHGNYNVRLKHILIPFRKKEYFWIKIKIMKLYLKLEWNFS